METKHSFCRVCPAFCAIEVDVDNGRVVDVRGDHADPMSRGYTCVKGRQLPHEINDRGRLRSSLVRTADGGFAPIPSEQAMDEVAQRLADTVAFTYLATAAPAHRALAGAALAPVLATGWALDRLCGKRGDTLDNLLVASKTAHDAS